MQEMGEQCEPRGNQLLRFYKESVKVTHVRRENSAAQLEQWN